jgi:hypothetical protein
MSGVRGYGPGRRASTACVEIDRSGMTELNLELLFFGFRVR